MIEEGLRIVRFCGMGREGAEDCEVLRIAGHLRENNKTRE